MLRPGAVRPHIKKGHSQAHPGVSALDPLTHRNTSFQPLPKPLGLPPYHYALADDFQSIAKHISDSGKMVINILGDSGGVQDAEFQSNVANEMINALAKAHKDFCYHVGDVVYFTGAHDDYYSQFYEPYERYTPPISPFPGIMTERLTIPLRKLRWMAGWPTSCRLIRTSTPFPRMRPA